MRLICWAMVWPSWLLFKIWCFSFRQKKQLQPSANIVPRWLTLCLQADHQNWRPSIVAFILFINPYIIMALPPSSELLFPSSHRCSGWLPVPKCPSQLSWSVVLLLILGVNHWPLLSGRRSGDFDSLTIVWIMLQFLFVWIYSNWSVWLVRTSTIQNWKAHWELIFSVYNICQKGISRTPHMTFSIHCFRPTCKSQNKVPMEKIRWVLQRAKDAPRRGLNP